jgi:hypothetical protein
MAQETGRLALSIIDRCSPHEARLVAGMVDRGRSGASRRHSWQPRETYVSDSPGRDQAGERGLDTLHKRFHSSLALSRRSCPERGGR